jgi:hypothetical protein
MYYVGLYCAYLFLLQNLKASIRECYIPNSNSLLSQILSLSLVNVPTAAALHRIALVSTSDPERSAHSSRPKQQPVTSTSFSRFSSQQTICSNTYRPTVHFLPVVKKKKKNITPRNRSWFLARVILDASNTTDDHSTPPPFRPLEPHTPPPPTLWSDAGLTVYHSCQRVTQNDRMTYFFDACFISFLSNTTADSLPLCFVFFAHQTTGLTTTTGACVCVCVCVCVYVLPSLFSCG